jgi:hypothetical protein
MTYQQAYYTSCTSGLRGSMGFQFNAASPGIEQRVLDQLERIGLYSPPRTAPIQPTAEELERFPVMLVYQRLDDGQMVFAQSKYVGLDYSGRWGNYFTHFLVAPPAGNGRADFLPIELWHAPVWTTKENNTPELPELCEVDLAGAIDVETVGAFVQQRAVHIAPMIEAARTALKTGRRVLIIDDPESIALWIAAVTYALPRPLALATSFTTYAKSPYDSGATIIGTTPDSDFRATDFEIEHQYSVFDFHSGRFSRIDASSRFARGVAAAYGESASRVANFPDFARRVDPNVTADDLDLTWFGYSLATGAPAIDDVTPADVRWFAKRLDRFTEEQLRVFLGSALAAIGTPGITDALFELYESSRRVASAAGVVETIAFPTLVREAIRSPEAYAARIVANAPYSAKEISDAGQRSADWFGALDTAPHASRVAALLAIGEVLGFGRLDAARLGKRLAQWIRDAAVQQRSLSVAAGTEVLAAILNALRESSQMPVLEPLGAWLGDERVRTATRDVFVTTEDIAFYTRILCARDRDRMHVFSSVLSGAQQLDGNLTAKQVDEVSTIVWPPNALSIDDAIRVCESCAPVLASTRFVQRLPMLLFAEAVDPVAAARLIEIVEDESLARAIGESRRLIEVYRVLEELARQQDEPEKTVAAAVRLLRGHLPAEVAKRLTQATPRALASLRDPARHGRLLLDAAKDREFLDAYEWRAAESLRADRRIANPSAALFFLAWRAHDEHGLLERVLWPEIRGWSGKRIQAVAVLILDPKSRDAWHDWIAEMRSRVKPGLLGRLFGFGRKPPRGSR